MNPIAILFLIVAVGVVLVGDRRWALIAFMSTCCYMTMGQGVVLGGLNLPVIRLVLIAALFRLVAKGEGFGGGLNKVDHWMIIWSVWLLFASFFHEWAPGSGPKYIMGTLLNTTGFYFLMRSFCQDVNDVEKLIVSLCLILVPVALLMVFEKVAHKNIFSVLGGVPEVPDYRNGKYRAQGPFNHSILAGVIGASCFPLAVGIWKRHRNVAIAGFVASVAMVIASASSTPIMSVSFSLFALGLWKFREKVHYLRKAIIPGYILLSLVMKREPYWLISKIDLTGSSTGWHRSFLIQQTLAYFHEWWLFGTDKTVHWMPGQGRISDIHTDITNQFIAYGVTAGLLCILILCVLLAFTFKTVGRLVSDKNMPPDHRFMFWCIGATMFSHTASALAVGYFGQSIFFFWLPIAVLAGFFLYESKTVSVEDDLVPEQEPVKPEPFLF